MLVFEFLVWVGSGFFLFSVQVFNWIKLLSKGVKVLILAVMFGGYVFFGMVSCMSNWYICGLNFSSVDVKFFMFLLYWLMFMCMMSVCIFLK